MVDKRNRPTRKRANALPEPPKAPNYDDETPKFCLRHLVDSYDVRSLPERQQAKFALALQDRATMTWQAINLAGKHGHGTGKMPKGEIKRQIPAHFAAETSFTVLRYDGNLPMIGVRVRDVFQIIWIEATYDDVYDH
jgi:hypothetical protein